MSEFNIYTRGCFKRTLLRNKTILRGSLKPCFCQTFQYAQWIYLKFENNSHSNITIQGTQKAVLLAANVSKVFTLQKKQTKLNQNLVYILHFQLLFVCTLEHKAKQTDYIYKSEDTLNQEYKQDSVQNWTYFYILFFLKINLRTS